MNNDFPFSHFINIPNNLENNQNSNKPFVPNELLNKTEEKENLNTATSEDFSSEELDFVNIEITKKIKQKVPSVKYNTFFGEIFTLTNIFYDLVQFSTSTEYIKTVIENHYLEEVAQAVKEVLGKEYKIKITATAGENAGNDLGITFNTETSSEEVGKKNSANQATFTLNLQNPIENKSDTIETSVLKNTNHSKFNFIVDPKKTFETFVVGPSNNMAHASARAVSTNPGKEYPCLYLHSDSGLGKTHLLHAVANKLKESNPELIVCITTAREFMNEMIDAVANKNIANFRKKYSEDIDVLMIDDVHELKNKQGTQNEFFHVFNELHNKGKQLIFTSDKHPKDIDGMEERIKTRLSWGLVLDIQKPDLETRIAILKNKANQEDIYLPDEVINLIATSIKANIRELEGSLIRLAAYASVFEVDIDVEIAKEQLKLNTIKDTSYITVESVTKSVSQYFKVPLADLKSKSRLKEVAHARHIAMFLIYNLVKPTPTYVEIGKFFGGRDHTSVLHGVEKIKKNSKIDQQLSQTLLEIENNL